MVRVLRGSSVEVLLSRFFCRGSSVEGLLSRFFSRRFLVERISLIVSRCSSIVKGLLSFLKDRFLERPSFENVSVKNDPSGCIPGKSRFDDRSRCKHLAGTEAMQLKHLPDGCRVDPNSCWSS